MLDLGLLLLITGGNAALFCDKRRKCCPFSWRAFSLATGGNALFCGFFFWPQEEMLPFLRYILLKTGGNAALFFGGVFLF